MARRNLSVPDALKAQMDELQGCNWSAIAQEAFRQTINLPNSTDYQRGVEDGKAWAISQALQAWKVTKME